MTLRHITIKDIAKIAGVSYATVSRALSGSTEISEATRQRILEICKQEGYRVNTLARSLIRSKSNVIGLIVPEITNPLYSEISLYIEMRAQALGYHVMLCNSRHEEARVGELFELLAGHQVDGIILASSHGRSCDWTTQYFKSMPTVLLGDAAVDDSPEGGELSTVCVDNFAGGCIGATHLCELGHERILYFGHRPTSATHRLRLQGFTSAIERFGLEVHALENPWEHSSIESGYELGKRLFHSGCHDTAIFASADSLALGLLRAAEECGVDIPGELSLLGFDNISFAALPKISLTSIDPCKQRLSDAAVDLLVHAIEDDAPVSPVRERIAPTLAIRGSCRRL